MLTTIKRIAICDFPNLKISLLSNERWPIFTGSFVRTNFASFRKFEASNMQYSGPFLVYLRRLNWNGSTTSRIMANMSLIVINWLRYDSICDGSKRCFLELNKLGIAWYWMYHQDGRWCTSILKLFHFVLGPPSLHKGKKLHFDSRKLRVQSNIFSTHKEELKAAWTGATPKKADATPVYFFGFSTADKDLM